MTQKDRTIFSSPLFTIVYAFYSVAQCEEKRSILIHFSTMILFSTKHRASVGYYSQNAETNIIANMLPYILSGSLAAKRRQDDFLKLE